MKYHQRKRDALLMAPQTERGYLRKAAGTPHLTTSDAYPDAFYTFSVAGAHRTDAPVSFPVREHTLTADDTKALTAVFTHTFTCASVADKLDGVRWLAIATNYGYALILRSVLSDTILTNYNRIGYEDLQSKAYVYATAGSQVVSCTVAVTQMRPREPLPDNTLDITDLCVSQQSYPAAAAIPAGTPVYWSSGNTVLRLETANRALQTGEILCVETYGGVRGMTIGRKTIPYEEVSALPAVGNRTLQRATLTRQMLVIPHLQYTYSGLADAGEELYYFALEEGYLILPQDLVTGEETSYVYDTFERRLSVYETGSQATYDEVEDGFWRTNELPDGLTAEKNLLSVEMSVISYAETMTSAFPSYSFAGKAGTGNETFCVRTSCGFLCIDGSAVSADMSYVFDASTAVLTCTDGNGETTIISEDLFSFSRERPAGSVFIACSSYNNDRKAEAWPAWRPCFLYATSGRCYTFTPEYALRPGVLVTLDEETLTVTCNNGLVYTASDAADALESDIANSPCLYLSDWQRKCVLLSGDSRSYTAVTPAPTHPAAFADAGGCTLSGGAENSTLAFPQTVADASPSVGFLLAGDDVSRDRFRKDASGRILLESRIGCYTFTGEEVPASVSLTDAGFTVAYTLLDDSAADGGGIFCTHFGCRNTTADAAQSVFCLTSGTAKAVFFLQKSAFPAGTESKAKQIFLAFLAECAASGHPVRVLFRRAATQTYDLTSAAAPFASLAPARGSGTLSFSAPEGGVLPNSTEAFYYSKKKGNENA